MLETRWQGESMVFMCRDATVSKAPELLEEEERRGGEEEEEEERRRGGGEEEEEERRRRAFNERSQNVRLVGRMCICTL